jgi:hypothetical protein
VVDGQRDAVVRAWSIKPVVVDPGYPSSAQNDEFDWHVERLGDDAVKSVLGLDRGAGYADVVYAFDALAWSAADRVLAQLRGRRSGRGRELARRVG